jgi:hypothetical protein
VPSKDVFVGDRTLHYGVVEMQGWSFPGVVVVGSSHVVQAQHSLHRQPPQSPQQQAQHHDASNSNSGGGGPYLLLFIGEGDTYAAVKRVNLTSIQ